jgi:hypothetical protein
MNDDRGISNGGCNPALQWRGALECDNDGTRVRVGADVNHLKTRYVNSKVNADEPLHYVSQLEIDQNRLLLNNKIGGKCRGWVGKAGRNGTMRSWRRMMPRSNSHAVSPTQTHELLLLLLPPPPPPPIGRCDGSISVANVVYGFTSNMPPRGRYLR